MKGRIFFVHILLILILGLTVYSNARQGGFVLDDYSLVKENFYIRSYKSLTMIFAKNLRESAHLGQSKFRPIPLVTYMLDYSFWKLDPEGYHLTNILLHVVNALCLYWFVVWLFGDYALALWASLFFIVLPVNTQAVTYISGRNDLLSFLFVLLSFIFYLKYLGQSNVIFYLSAVLFYGFGLLSKENSLILPLLLLLYHYAFKKKIRPVAFASFLSLAGFVVLLRLTILRAAPLRITDVDTVFQRLPGFFVAFINYLRLLVLPFGLHMLYSRKHFALTDPRVLFGILIFVFFLWLLYKKRKKDALVFFGMGWFILALLPVSNIYPLAAYMAESWLYLPSLGFCLILAKIMAGSDFNNHLRLMSKLFLGGLLVFYALVTIKQNEYWKEPVSFYSRILKFNPESVVAYTGLGVAYEERGRINEAIKAYQKAISLGFAYQKPYNNLGLIYYGLGRNEEAIALYNKAMEINPRFPNTYNNLGVIYARSKNPKDKERAVSLFRKAISLEPNFASAYYNLGNVLSDLGRHEEAVPIYKRVIELNPTHVKAYDDLGIAYRSIGHYDDAIIFYKEAIKLNPRYASPYYNLAMVYREKGQNKEAIAVFKQALELEPKNIDIINSLASLYETTGRHDKATDLYDKALEIDPENPILYFNMGNVSLGLGRRQEAIDLYKKALDYDPEFGQAYENLAVAYFYEGKYDLAIEAADRATKLGVSNPGLLDALKPYRSR